MPKIDPSDHLEDDLEDVSQLSADADKPEPDTGSPAAPKADAEPETAGDSSGDGDGEARAVSSATTGRIIVGGRSWYQKIGDAYMVHKRWTLPLTGVALIATLLAVPQTRYPILGIAMTNDFKVIVVDAKTGKPVTAAMVTAAKARAVTNNNGIATIRTKVGTQQFTVTKKYYKNTATRALVPITQKGDPQKLTVQASGRQVPVIVTNRISGKPLANATLTAEGSEAKTDNDGKAVLVLPADKTAAEASISATGYIDAKSKVVVTEQETKQNSFALVPRGKVYFLSKLTGKIDVVKTNLDGTERQVVLAGTGSEDNYDTILLASRDWRYLALKSKRDGGENAKLFLIDTTTDKLTTMDEGNAGFTPVGWSGGYFVYTVFRNGFANWQPGAVSLKSYNAQSGKLAVLDTTRATGSSNADARYETLQQTYILKDSVVFNKVWYAYPGYFNVPGQQNTLTSVGPDGSNKTVVARYEGNEAYFDNGRLYDAPNKLILRVVSIGGGPDKFLAYENGKVTAANDMTPEKFNREYPTFLESPNGKAVFWSDSRDGRNVLFIGDQDAKNEKQIASLSELTPYGWYTDDYLFASRNGSELYIMAADGSGTPLKVTDYHKPNTSFRGYGGYGGL